MRFRFLNVLGFRSGTVRHVALGPFVVLNGKPEDFVRSFEIVLTDHEEEARDSRRQSRQDSFGRSLQAARNASSTKKVGGDIVVAKLNEDGTVKSIEPFVTGFIEDNKYVGRPADIAIMKDGSLLISDDYNGAIYRVTYAK